MSWDCPHWDNEICELNGMTCTPGKGHCVLRNRFQIISGEKSKNEKDSTVNQNRKKQFKQNS